MEFLIFKKFVLSILKSIPDFIDVFCIGILIIAIVTLCLTHKRPLN